MVCMFLRIQEEACVFSWEEMSYPLLKTGSSSRSRRMIRIHNQISRSSHENTKIIMDFNEAQILPYNWLSKYTTCRSGRSPITGLALEREHHPDVFNGIKRRDLPALEATTSR
jgi:hypothetical protein